MGVLEDESTLKILEKLRNRRLRDFMRWGGGGYYQEMKWKDELQTRSLLLLRRWGCTEGGRRRSEGRG